MEVMICSNKLKSVLSLTFQTMVRLQIKSFCQDHFMNMEIGIFSEMSD